MVLYLMEYVAPHEDETTGEKYPSDFVKVDVVDTWISLIWTERYSRCGDFELYLHATKQNVERFTLDRMLYRADTNRIMFIEKIEYKTDIENGNTLVITGRSFEILLNRRIVWGYFGTGDSKGQESILYKIINNNCIDDKDFTSRNYDFLEVPAESEYQFSDWGGATMSFLGDSLYDVAVEICENHNVGMKMDFYTNASGVKKFKFHLYEGTNHAIRPSSTDTTFTQVTFSPDFNNILTCDYSKDSSEYGSHFLAAGKGDGSDRAWMTYYTMANLQAWDIWDVFVDARDADGDDEAAAKKAAYQEAMDAVADHRIKNDFTATITNTSVYKYKEDFDIGDLVQLEDLYGHKFPTRITKIVENWDANNGYTIELTFGNSSN